MHILTARCDMETGKSLNIAPPGWQKTFDPLRDAFNHEHGWSRPDDPARARTQQPGHRAYIEAANLRAGLEHEADPRELIRDYLVQRVEHGVVQSRADVVAALEDAGLEVPRQGKGYVTAHDPESGKRWRLKGRCTSMTSTPNELTSRLRRRLEADHRQIEETAASELRRLGESLSAVVNGGLRTIEADTASAVGRLSAVLRRAWLLPLVAGLSLSLGIVGGSWAGTRWLWTTIEQQIETLAVLCVDIKEARATLARIEETTWGLELTEIDGDRFVVLPAGTLDSPPWTVGGRPALKLSSE